MTKPVLTMTDDIMDKCWRYYYISKRKKDLQDQVKNNRRNK